MQVRRVRSYLPLQGGSGGRSPCWTSHAFTVPQRQRRPPVGRRITGGPTPALIHRWMVRSLVLSAVANCFLVSSASSSYSGTSSLQMTLSGALWRGLNVSGHESTAQSASGWT
jgi:hypothetical protein